MKALIKKDSLLNVIQSNNLVTANYNLSVTEQRIIYYAMSRLNPFEDIPRVNMITAIEFGEFFGIKPNKAYERLKEAAATLYERNIKIKNKESDETDYSEQRWLTNKAVYKSGSGAVRISFTPEILKELNNLLNTGEFTQIKLQRVIGMQSSYSIRLYTNMMKWKTIGKLKITVAELREMFELEDTHKLYGDLKSKVIVKAIKEIEAHANLTIELTERKTGRKITHLKFIFKENEQQNLKLV